MNNILKIVQNPNKDAQLRTRFILLIPEIFVSSAKDADQKFLKTYLDEILKEMLIPNVVWKAGRSASAVRLSTTASILLLIQNDIVKSIQLNEQTIDSLKKMMLSCLDDDNKSTRLYASKILVILLTNYGRALDFDELHKLYPEFIKRLDDQSNEVRLEILKGFNVYFECFKGRNYDKILYKAHLQNIFENLLLYLDDPNSDFQLKILGMSLFYCCSFICTNLICTYLFKIY